MSKTHFRYGRNSAAVLFVAGLVSLAGPSALEAQRPAAQEVAAVSAFPGGLDFLPQVGYSWAIITWSGGDRYFRQEFAAGESPFIGTFDLQGQPLPDGTYTWELELVPDRVAARDLMIAASKSGGLAPSTRSALSGSFAILNGAIVDSELVEPEPIQATGRTQLTGDVAVASGLMPVARVDQGDSDEAVAAGHQVEGRDSGATVGRQTTEDMATALGLTLLARADQRDSDAAVAAAGDN